MLKENMGKNSYNIEFGDIFLKEELSSLDELTVVADVFSNLCTLSLMDRDHSYKKNNLILKANKYLADYHTVLVAKNTEQNLVNKEIMTKNLVVDLCNKNELSHYLKKSVFTL
jgi:hypothetical protein